MIQQCDFCCDIPISAIYDAKTMDTSRAGDEVLKHFSSGWAACYACEMLIDANAWPVLVRRVVTMTIFRTPILSWCREEIEARLSLIYAELQSLGITKRRSGIT